MEILKKFCSRDQNKYQLIEPFSQGDYTYATDGRAAIRVPRVDGIGENENAPNMEFLKWDHADLTDWCDLPEYAIDKTVKCPDCGGHGKIAFCPECDGEGEVFFENAYSEYEICCDTCRGLGSIASESCHICDACDGTGINHRQPIEFGEVHIQALLLNRIAQLEGAKLYQPSDIHMPIKFIFDGGCGLVMPMRGNLE